jgi:cellulose biosynthesis protein BcsQ
MFDFAFDFLQSLAHEDPAVVAKTVVAFFGGLATGFFVAKPFLTTNSSELRATQKHAQTLESQIRHLESQVKHHEETEEKLTSELLAARDRHQADAEFSLKLKSAGKKLLQKFDVLKKDHDRLVKQVTSVVDSEGRLWEQEVEPNAVRFVPMTERRARIISLMNLKGGVGKTTLTANLSYMLAAQGDRVLVIDLDNQASLTSLLCTPKSINKIQAGKRFIRTAFEMNGQGVLPHHITEDVPDTRITVAPADENLSAEEHRVMSSWMMKTLPLDGRLILRNVLHQEPFSREYDWILIDCPPGLTTSSVNALACSDYLLIPVVPDKVSIDAVPRMLRWVSKLKNDKVKLCPHLSLLGIIPSMTYYSKSLTNREKDAWLELADLAKLGYWHQTPYLFKSFIPNKVAFEDSVNDDQFPRVAVRDPQVELIFKKVVNEFKKQVPIHGSYASSSVPH